MRYSNGRMWGLLVACAMMVGCAEGTIPSENEQRDTRGPTEVGGKGDIYGDDDRIDAHESYDPVMNAVADATAVLVDESKVEPAQGHRQMKLVDETFGEEKNLCDGEPFRDQPAPGFCTGFLVGPDTLATAGHCLDDVDECEETRFVFDFRYESAEDDPAIVHESDVYTCDDLLARHHDSEGADWAVVRLDRTVRGRTAVEYRQTGKVEEGAMVALVGHPSGLPQKISGGGRVFDSTAETHFDSNLDTYGGNSGSPVVNFATGLVEGIHVRGTTDFVETEAGCSVSRVCGEVGDEGCSGNSATRATEFSPYVPPAMSDTDWGRWTSPAEFETFQTEDGLTQGVSRIEVEASGTVDYAQIELRIDDSLDGAEVYLDRNYGDTVNLSQYFHERGGPGGAVAVPDFNGTLAAATWRLRVVTTGDRLPDIEGWTLDLHTD